MATDYDAPTWMVEPFICPSLAGREMRCNLAGQRLADGRTVVIATERTDNPGPSVTNAAEVAAAWACHWRRIPPASLVWIEHYPPDAYATHAARAAAKGCVLAAGVRGHTFDLVRFHVAPGWGGQYYPPEAWHFTDPYWRQMEPADWEELELLPGGGRPRSR